MAIPVRWLSMLRDPAGLEPLELDGEELVNMSSGRRYPIVESIPVLLERAELGPQNVKYQGMYDWTCHGYDLFQRVGDLIYRGALARLRRDLAGRLSLKAGDRVLYTSIGTGLDAPYYAERLPLVNGVFDVVLHVGGIDFFDRPEAAVKEMLRVAKGGALILIADETKDVVTKNYQRIPLTRGYFKDAPVDFRPREWVPEGVGEPQYEEVWGGRGYILMFRAPVT